MTLPFITMITTRILAIFITAFLFAAFSPCFAKVDDIQVTKEKAKELGLELRSKPKGSLVEVEMEFKPEGHFKDFSHVKLEINDGEKTLFRQALLQGARADSGNLVFSMEVDSSLLDKVFLSVCRMDNDLQGHDEVQAFEVRVKDFVEPEKSPLRSPEMGKNITAKEVAAAKAQGAETAAQDIKAGVFRILYFGEPYSNDKPLVDDATGFRVQIVAGCVVSSQFVAEADAYNKAMRDWHSKNPLSLQKK